MSKSANSESFFEEDDTTAWMITYSDLMTLLLVFFILLFSISSLNIEKFRDVLQSIRVNPGSGQPTTSLLEFVEVPSALDTELTIEQLTGLKVDKKPSGTDIQQTETDIEDDIQQFITQKDIGENVVLEVLDGKIIIRVRGKILFESGSAILQKNARPILDEIIAILDEYSEYKINIKGYTDDIPIKTTQFPSNWELSAIRATSILKYLIEKNVRPERLTATGFGSLSPVVPNTSKFNRAINRRVEFVLEKENLYQQ
jgi:chemotaxis protein MotB